MESIPLPPEPLRERVAGTKDSAAFDRSGAATVDEWERALASVGKEFGDFSTIVDFGCGCGRAIRHLAGRIDPRSQTLIGMDPDAEAVEWVGRNIEHVRVHALDASPPSPLPDESVDLIVSHSVFTHLPEEVQYGWLGEMRRILKPGGLAITTFHGARAFETYRGSLVAAGRGDLAQTFAAECEARGFLHVPGRTAAESALPSYYGAAFHTIGYVCRNWSRYFTILAWFPEFALSLQDTLLLRKDRGGSDPSTGEVFPGREK